MAYVNAIGNDDTNNYIEEEGKALTVITILITTDMLTSGVSSCFSFEEGLCSITSI